MEEINENFEYEYVKDIKLIPKIFRFHVFTPIILPVPGLSIVLSFENNFVHLIL